MIWIKLKQGGVYICDNHYFQKHCIIIKHKLYEKRLFRKPKLIGEIYGEIKLG